MKLNENEMNFSVPLEIIKASEIEPKEVKWLWYPYIPFGKVTLLQGDPGDGKSKLMLSIAALLSKGEPIPFSLVLVFADERYTERIKTECLSVGQSVFVIEVSKEVKGEHPCPRHLCRRSLKVS